MSHVFSHSWERGRIRGGAEHFGVGRISAGAGKGLGFKGIFQPTRAECA